VNVEVMPPIDTGNWSADSIDAHVAEVRNLYLQALDQKKFMEVL
jgi:putative phosphoserine phosphatase/1-acylglycerol-3-phosphate O-acyltransferase